MGTIQRLSENNPLFMGMVILMLALLFRINDIFVLRIDEQWGEIFISKAIGFLLVLLYLFLSNKSISFIGLRRTNITVNLILGAILTIAIYFLAYLIEYFVMTFSFEEPIILFSAIDSKQGRYGGALFALWLLLGNIVNAFMEEGLFRGLLIPKFMTRFSFWASNLLQAFLFGIWHLVWPLKDLMVGEVSLSGAVSGSGIIFIGTFINGFVWGYMFFKTESLWTPWISHVMANSVLNFIHIQTAVELDPFIMIRNVVVSNLFLLSIFLIKKVCEHKKVSHNLSR
ncbi:MAG: CPBP family intramembrane metalloprotease [Bacillaceae bacterium]|nr:CPBP family intramembrane metalloprotease [Bacillaceae bacterium]